MLIIALGTGCLGLGALVSTVPVASASAPSYPLATQAFNPLSVTFVSLNTGWVLGTLPCARLMTCPALLGTVDAGSSWSARPLPAGLRAAVAGSRTDLIDATQGGGGLNVRFANLLDGWIYGGLPNGGPVIWSTHNGGSTWRRQPLAGLATDDPILDLETANGVVYFMAMNAAQQRVVVESSPVSQDAWRLDQAPPLFLPAGGGELGGSIVLQGGYGWLVEGNDRGITGSAELEGTDRWTSWAPPCQNVGNSFTVPAASSASNLVAICVMGGFASPLSESAPPGAKVGSTWLYFSDNYGRSFQAEAELGSLGGPFFGEVLASPNPSTIITSRSAGTSNQLVGSFDGGHHWDVVFRGNPFYLGFTSAEQAVGLVQVTDNRTAMIMTFDGGHRWTRVNV
jgi:hypothetical protein